MTNRLESRSRWHQSSRLMASVLLQAHRPLPPGFENLLSPNHSYGSDTSHTSSSRDGHDQSYAAPGSLAQLNAAGTSHGRSNQEALTALLGAGHWPPTSSTRPPPPGFGPNPHGASDMRSESHGSIGLNGSVQSFPSGPRMPLSQETSQPLLREVSGQANGYPLPGQPRPSSISSKPPHNGYQNGYPLSGGASVGGQNGYQLAGGDSSHVGSSGWSVNGNLERYRGAPSQQTAGSRGPPPGMAANVHSAVGLRPQHPSQQLQQYPPQQLLLSSGPVPRRAHSRFQFAQGTSIPEAQLRLLSHAPSSSPSPWPLSNQRPGEQMGLRCQWADFWA